MKEAREQNSAATAADRVRHEDERRSLPASEAAPRAADRATVWINND